MRSIRSAMTIVFAACAIGMLALPAMADPAGNNGTVKLDGKPFDSAPDNQPHVGCSFQVDFYGYDMGNYNATVDFDLQAPTGSAHLVTKTVFVGEDAAGGGTDLDASLTVNLSSALAQYTPQPNQGYHVYLTVNAPASNGATVKHKAFWVGACAS